MEVLPGGGHIASWIRKTGDGAQINPFWVPPWPTIDPSHFEQIKTGDYGEGADAKLLASISGHLTCLDSFGPSECGVHGEFPITEFACQTLDNGIALRATLPLARLAIQRVIEFLNPSIVMVHTEVRNLNDTPRTVCWQEHPTFGPPFMEPEVTTVDMVRSRVSVLPDWHPNQSVVNHGLGTDWPEVMMCSPLGGEFLGSLRKLDPPAYGRFTPQLIDPEEYYAWFTVINPRLKLLIGYLWGRESFPYIGNWEEVCGRDKAPWNSRTIARGIEFGLSPDPAGREALIEREQRDGSKYTITIPPGDRPLKRSFLMFLFPLDDGEPTVEAVESQYGKLIVRLAGGRHIAQRMSAEPCNPMTNGKDDH